MTYLDDHMNDIFGISYQMYSLCQDCSHRILARVIPLEEHVLELGVDILNLFVHLLKYDSCVHTHSNL